MKATPNTQGTIKILIVDNQKIDRETLSLYLSSQENFQVVGTAASGEMALEKVMRLQPDIVVIDLEIAGMSGMTVVEMISDSHPEIKTFVLSTHEEKSYIDQAITAGALGYFIKGTAPEDLIAAILKVHQGYFQLGEGLLDKLKSTFYVQPTPDNDAIVDKITDPVEVNPPRLTSTTRLSSNLKDLTLEELRLKLEVLEQNKAFIQQKYSKLRRKFSLLMATQVILGFVTVGCISSIVKMNLETVPERANVTNISQPNK